MRCPERVEGHIKANLGIATNSSLRPEMGLSIMNNACRDDSNDNIPGGFSPQSSPSAKQHGHLVSQLEGERLVVVFPSLPPPLLVPNHTWNPPAPKAPSFLSICPFNSLLAVFLCPS